MLDWFVDTNPLVYSAGAGRLVQAGKVRGLLCSHSHRNVRPGIRRYI